MYSVLEEELTQREREIAELLLKGECNKDIARQLSIRERTVKYHCGNIYQKYQVENRIELKFKIKKLG